MGTIGSAVLTFIGHKQTDKLNLFIDSQTKLKPIQKNSLLYWVSSTEDLWQISPEVPEVWLDILKHKQTDTDNNTFLKIMKKYQIKRCISRFGFMVGAF